MIAALVAIAGSAAAATPTELYLATKETAVAALKHPEGTAQPPGNDRLEADALRRLSSLIGRVIGPIAVRGFPAQGVSNIVSLSDGEMESGHVDGIRAVSPDGTILLVTTVALVQSWLKVNAGYARIAQGPAQAPLQDTATTVGKALADGAFYTQALASEAALNIYAAIPLPPKPGKAGAQAFLTKASQDNLAPFPPTA